MPQKWIDRVRETLLTSPRVLADDPRLASRALAEDRVRAVAGVQRLADIGRSNSRIVPAAALIGRDTRLAVLREAVEHGVRILLVEAADEAEAARLVAALPGEMVPLERQAAASTLFGANTELLLDHELERDPAAEAAFHGISTRYVSRSVLRAFPADMPATRVGVIHRFLSDVRLPVYLVVFVYSALRALPVALVKQFHGSLLVLWSIDIVTAVPYTWGILTMLFGHRWQLRLIAALTTIATFTAPYVYFWMNGRDYPPHVPAVIVGLTLLTVGLELGKYLQERGLRRRYRERRRSPGGALGHHGAYQAHEYQPGA